MCSLSEFVTKKIGEIFQSEVAFKKKKESKEYNYKALLPAIYNKIAVAIKSTYLFVLFYFIEKLISNQ